MRASYQRRSGIAAIVVLVVTSVIMSIVATAMVATVRSNRERKVERYQIQLRFINEAGALRAVKKWKDDPSFSGDEWGLSIDTQSGLSATISSSFQQDGNGSKMIEIVSILDHPNPHHRMQLTVTYPIQTSKDSKE